MSFWSKLGLEHIARISPVDTSEIIAAVGFSSLFSICSNFLNVIINGSF